MPGFRRLCGVLAAVLVFGPLPALAQELDKGDTAWVLTSTALVLFMTLPGLALFYGGLVRATNVLSVLMHCTAIAGLATLLWLIVAYSLAFGEGGALIGPLDKAFLLGVGRDALKGSIPETVFFTFQMTFAIITPALIVGAYPERMRFGAVLLVSALWLLVVYAPVTHWVWGGGWLGGLGVLDFAGGIVVHVTAGVSALVIAAMLGGRRGFPNDLRPPHNPGMTMIGAGMLWVGWFGFNAGSALAADGNAGMAMTVTQISASAAALSWAAAEWLRFGKPSLVGIVTGVIAGLATITPASGYVGPGAALALGLIAGVLCQYMTQLVKRSMRIDDSLDVFAVHGVGGALGTLLAAVFVAAPLGGVGYAEGKSFASQLGVQALGVVAVAAWSAAATWGVVKLASALTGLRVSEEAEFEGLDLVAHGERAYDL